MTVLNDGAPVVSAGVHPGVVDTVTIEAVSDIVCPLSYIAHRRMDIAVAAAKAEGLPLEFVFQHRPFQIDCQLPQNASINREDRMKCKFGPKVDGMFEMLQEQGKPIGIDFKRGGKIGSTVDAHRLLMLAMQKGGPTLQHKVLSSLYHGFFEKLADDSCPLFLSCIASASGLFPSREAARSWLEGDEYREEVKEACRRERERGVKGVPFVVLRSKRGKLAVCGAQEPQKYLDLFRLIASGENITKAAAVGSMVTEGKGTNACVS